MDCIHLLLSLITGSNTFHQDVLTDFFSCEPNAIISFDGNKLVVRALENIPRGTEITIAYVELYAPLDVRRDALLSRKGFLCRCSRCRRPIDHPLESRIAAGPKEVTSYAYMFALRNLFNCDESNYSDNRQGPRRLELCFAWIPNSSTQVKPLHSHAGRWNLSEDTLSKICLLLLASFRSTMLTLDISWPYDLDLARGWQCADVRQLDNVWYLQIARRCMPGKESLYRQFFDTFQGSQAPWWNYEILSTCAGGSQKSSAQKPSHTCIDGTALCRCHDEIFWPGLSGNMRCQQWRMSFTRASEMPSLATIRRFLFSKTSMADIIERLWGFSRNFMSLASAANE